MAVIALIFKIIGIVLLAVIALLVILLHFSIVVRVHAGADGFSYTVKYLGFTIMPREEKSKKTDSNTSPSEDNDVTDEDISALDPDDDDLETEVERYELEHSDDTSYAISDDIPEVYEAVQSDDDTEKPVAVKDIAKDKNDGIKTAEKKTEQKSDKGKAEKSKKTDSGKRSGGLRAKIDSYKRKYENIKPYIPYTWKMFKKMLKAVRISVDDVRMMIGREDAHEAVIYYGGLQAVIANVLTVLCGMFSVTVKKCDVSCRFAKNYFNGSGDISVRVRPSAVIAIIVCIAVNAGIIFIRQKLEARKTAKAAAESI